MRKLTTILTALFISTTPALSGERVENLGYTTPASQLILGFACVEEEFLHSFLDNFEMHVEQQMTPPGCVILSQPQMLPEGVDELSHLYLADDSKLWGIIEVTLGEHIVYTFVPESALIKENPNGDT